MITILSYCDTNEKKNQLSNLIGVYSEKSFFSHLPEDVNIEEITLLSVNSKEIEPYSIDGLNDIYWKSNFHEPFFD